MLKARPEFSKNITTKKAKKLVAESFGPYLPVAYNWVGSKSGSIITWSLVDSSHKNRVIAKIINDGKTRKILLDNKLFSVRTHKKNPNEKKKSKQFPPPFKPSFDLLQKLAEKYRIHENPDPPDCPTCGLRYADLKTGLDFGSVQDMLFVSEEDPSKWRHKGRHSVLGLWFEIKRSMWQDHLEMCQKPKKQAQWFKDFDPEDFEY